MRQTRRSRSAVTPQKDEPVNPTEEVISKEEISVKANLETVFEKEDDVEKGSEAVEEASAADTKIDDNAEPKEENQTPATENETAEEVKQDEVSTNISGSPKKSDAGLIELNCQVCNCSFTNYHEHMNSESHKSKISHSPSKTDTQAGAEKPATNQAQKRAGDQDSAPSPKRMKNQNASNAPVEKFHCDVCKLTILKQQDFDQHMNGKRHLLNVTRAQGKSYCDVCKLFFNSQTDLNDHEESQMHKKNVADKKQFKEQFECKTCNVTSLGQKQYDQHLTSRRHKRSLENATAVAKPATTATTATAATAVNGKTEAKPVVLEKKWLYLCNACNYGCNFDNQFSSHMILAEHKAAVIDMKNKGLLKPQRDGAKSAKFANKSAVANKPAAANAAPARKFIPGNTGNRPNAGVNKPGPKPTNNAAGPGPSVTYNVVSGPNVNAAAAVAVQKPGPQVNRKVPAAGPGGPKKNIPPNKPNAVMTKPPFGQRPNPRFPGKPAENIPNKFVANQQSMKPGFQNSAVGFRNSGGNFGPGVPPHHEAAHSAGNFGAYRPANFGGNMRSDMNQGSDLRNDFRGNVRDDFRSDVRDIRDIRDIRNVDTSANSRGDVGFRSGFYREMPAESSRADFRTFNDVDRVDVRSGPVGDVADMRGLARNDLADIRGYSNTDMRDLQSDNRNDYSRERTTMSGYGASAFGQTYRGNDDFRSDNYARAAQSSASATGNYSSGMMSSGRYENYMDRNPSAYSNQYSASSRGMGYMGNVSLNGR